MKTLKILSLALLGSMLAALMGAYLIHTSQTDASTTWGNDYYAYVATSTKTGTSTLRSRGGSLGSVIVTGTSSVVAPLRFYDTATTTVATSSLREIAAVATNATPGTYVFDIALGSGLLVDVPAGFTGNYTITYR